MWLYLVWLMRMESRGGRSRGEYAPEALWTNSLERRRGRQGSQGRKRRRWWGRGKGRQREREG
jgi:hypothetical protein